MGVVEADTFTGKAVEYGRSKGGVRFERIVNAGVAAPVVGKEEENVRARLRSSFCGLGGDCQPTKAHSHGLKKCSTIHSVRCRVHTVTF